MKLAFCVIALVLLGSSAAQSSANDKVTCLLGLDLSSTKTQKTGRTLSSTSNSDVVKKAVTNLLKLYPSMNAADRAKIDKCKLNMEPALKRCKAAHQKDCEAFGPLVNRKCTNPKTKLVDALYCSVECPKGYTDGMMLCWKPNSSKSDHFDTEAQCKTATKTTCEQWVLSFWVPKCGEGFRRVGADQCVPICPPGWLDQARFCLKPQYEARSSPMTWLPEDK